MYVLHIRQYFMQILRSTYCRGKPLRLWSLGYGGRSYLVSSSNVGEALSDLLRLVNGQEMGSGTGRSKGAARDSAAIQAVQRLRNENFSFGIS